MKYLTFSTVNDRAPRLGVLHADRVVEVKQPASLLELIRAGRDAWARTADTIHDQLSKGADDGHRADAVHWHAPIPRPLKNVFCLGLNYLSHIQETSRGNDAAALEAPVFFSKAPNTVNGPFDSIMWDRSITDQVDWEAELGVIIGVGGKNIQRGSALDHVFGYTVVNDISARDLQFKHKQWLKGKSLDGFCPMGPCVVTPDEFGNPQTKRVSLRVNGVTKQDGSTAEMVRPVDAIIEHLSLGMTLDPGDIISTGTPQGVGMARKPPEYLKDGDIVEADVVGIGTLRNRCVVAT